MKKHRILTAVLGILFTFSCFINGRAAEIDSLLAAGDQAYQNFDNRSALNLYAKAYKMDTTSYQAAWKLSRAYVDVGETIKDDDTRREAYLKGEKYARQAVQLAPDSSMGHLTLSIALGRVALDAGAKERIKLSKEIKAEADRALEIDPRNDIAWHVLGRWNRKLASLSWVEKRFANMFLGGVPKDASMERAVECFQKAIEINPKYINHHYELGLTYEKMDKKDLAIQQYKKVLELPKTDAEDDKYKAEAKERLEDLQ